MRNDPSETRHVIEQLKKEIRELTEKQSQALESAKYVGLSRDDKKKYDERLARIGKLRRELSAIEDSTPGTP